MRNAAATFDDDLGYDTPRRPPAPRKPRGTGGAGKKRMAKRPRLDMTKVARWAAIGMGATMAVGIMVNALMLQKGHHPAPLFGSTSTIALKPAVAAVAAAAPPLRTARVEPIEAKRPTPAPLSKAAIRPAAEPGDAIGKLIAGGTPAASAKSEVKGDRKSDSRTVTGVQRALTKLGYKVPATGTAGPATRKAIEAFEKEHHLPAKGAVDHRLVKLLATESKTKID